MKDLHLTKHTLFLFEGDFEELRAIHPEIGASIVVRQLVRRYIEDMRARADAVSKTEVKVEL